MKIRKSMSSLISNTDGTKKATAVDPTQYADLLFGVGSATSAGPSLPSGSIHPCPETLENDNGGYLRNQAIVGFGHAYVSGTGGTKCYGNYLLAPMTDAVEIDNSKRAVYAKAGSEEAKCYEYSVTLENGIKARVSPTHNAAIHTFEYPAGKSPVFLIDVARKMENDAAMKEGYVTVDPVSNQIYGGGLYFGNWNDAQWNMYFALEFDGNFTEMGTFLDEALTEETKTEKTTVSINELHRLGAYVKFPHSDKCPTTVKVKIAISFVSAEQAQEFLREQIPAFDYEAVREAAREKWREVMDVIELKTDDTALLRRFYTAMYHMNIQPRDRTSDHGYWDDFHTVWDTWKTVFPMYSLLYPEKMSKIVESFIDRVKTNEEKGNGIVLGDQFMTAKEGLAGQGGNDVDNAIADAYLKGIRLTRYDWEDAYKVLLASAQRMRSREYIENGYASNCRKTASGVDYTWRFRPAAATMGFAFNDKAVAAVARELGTKEEYEYYEKRSANWLNVWNCGLESEGFFGFPQSRNEDGDFDLDFDAHGGYNTHFYEATAWDASYINYNDVPRLVETMGGAETFTRRLIWACEHSVNYYNDDHGKEGYLNFTNEPSFQIPWLFCTDEIRRPDLAAKVIDTVIARFSQLNDYPGDEDNGGMSSYYIFLMCGFFPYATTENYYLHGTRVEEIVFHLGNGKDFRVTGENVGGSNIYVQSATWQGMELNECKLTHSQIIEGGELHFVMGNKPSDWGHKK